MTVTLDTKGLVCPEPVIRTERRLHDLPPGSDLTILVTDPAAPIDFEAFCVHKGHHYLGCQNHDQWLEIRIQKNAG